MSASSEKPDIAGREDIITIVDSFYKKIHDDDLLGFIFDEIANVNWETHLPKMYDFWETMLFRAANYKGNPLHPHLKVSAQTPMGKEQFERWKKIFFATIDERFAGETAEHMKNAAADMAQVMLSKITGKQIPLTFEPGSERP